MAQLIFLDTGMMLDAGHTQAEYEARDDWDPLSMAVVDTGQTFEPFNPALPAQGWVPKCQKWFFFPTLNSFFQSTSKKHAILSAAETLFSPSRWDEIKSAVEEQGSFSRSLSRLDLSEARKKIIRARDKGLITPQEVSDLAALVAHLP